MLPHSQDSKTSSSTQSGIIKIGPKIGSNSRSFEHPSVQTVQLKVCETLVPTFCLQQFQFKSFKSVRSSKSDIYSDRLARRRGLTNILTKQFLPHKIKIRAQRKPRNQRNNTRALRKLHQGYKNSGICKQNPNVLQPCACCAKNKNVKTFRHHKKEYVAAIRKRTSHEPLQLRSHTPHVTSLLFKKKSLGCQKWCTNDGFSAFDIISFLAMLTYWRRG